MNYDVSAGRLAPIMEQTDFCLDLASPDRRIAVEYDGSDHDNPSKDKRRRNELGALGWRVFPLGKEVLYNPYATSRFGKQLREVFGLRNRWPKNWDEKYVELRKSIGLPF